VGNLITGSASNGPFPYTLTAGTTPIFGSDNNGPQIDTDCTITATANICGGSLAQGGSSAIIGNLLSHSDYSLAEGTLDTKWSKTSITCGTTNVYPGGSSFTVPAGGGVTCTIVNTLVNGALTIIKHVENNNGGTATASQFTMLLNGVSKGGGAESPGNTYELPAGTQYTVDENMNSIVGYSKTLSTDCVGTIQPNVTKVCTIINDDIAPSLHLVKTVHNNFGGTATASAFSLTATGPTTISGNGDVQSTGTFSAGSYTLTEGTVNGYELETDWACSGPNGATQNGGSLTIGLAQAWTCTIVNKDKKASPTADTTPSTILHDTMTITGIRAGASNASSATVTFKLFSDSGCTVQVGSTEVRPVSSGAASTVNGVVVNTNGTYRWTAVYSGDNFNNPYTKQCGTEVVTVGISVTPNP
jgi:hypothetical protein